MMVHAVPHHVGLRSLSRLQSTPCRYVAATWLLPAVLHYVACTLMQQVPCSAEQQGQHAHTAATAVHGAVSSAHSNTQQHSATQVVYADGNPAWTLDQIAGLAFGVRCCDGANTCNTNCQAFCLLIKPLPTGTAAWALLLDTDLTCCVLAHLRAARACTGFAGGVLRSGWCSGPRGGKGAAA